MSLDLQTVANRYARAMFELAQEQDQLASVHQELMALRDVFNENPRLAPMLSGIKLSLAQKESLLQALKEGVSQPVANLIQMVFDYGRMNAMVGSCARSFWPDAGIGPAWGCCWDWCA